MDRPVVPFIPGINAESIASELEKILASKVFAQTEALRRLLRYVVEQTLLGRADRLKEYSLAIDVFQRSESFDHRTDAIVRVQAGRLRSKLEEFYAGEGRLDPVVIDLPKGSYVPVFRLREPAAAQPLRSRARFAWLAGLALIMAATAVLFGPLKRQFADAGRLGTPSAGASVAVLPFTNLSRQPDQDFFCDGIAEEIGNALSQVAGLRVAARTSAFEFKGKNADAREIGRRLNVGTVLEGSVRASGDRLRITAELVNANDGFRLWSQTYERPMQDAFAIQEEISRAIVTAMKARVPAAASSPNRHTPDPEAYKLYLKGRYHAADNRAWAADAIRYFGEAVKKDPNFAAAWAALAIAHYSTADSKDTLPRDAIRDTREAAARALQLDDSIAEAHEAMAYAKWAGDWDWDGAAAEFRRAIELRSDSEDARVGYARWLCYAGRHNTAREQIAQMQSAEPLSVRAAGVQASIAYYSRDFDEAIHICQDTLSANPQARSMRYWLGRAYAAQGRIKEALEQFDLQGPSGNAPQGFGMPAYIYAKAGRRAEALALLERVKLRAQSHYVSPVSLALAYIGLGETAQAVAALNQALADHDPSLVSLKVDPTFDALRNYPEFKSVVAKLRFPTSRPQ